MCQRPSEEESALTRVGHSREQRLGPSLGRVAPLVRTMREEGVEQLRSLLLSRECQEGDDIILSNPHLSYSLSAREGLLPHFG